MICSCKIPDDLVGVSFSYPEDKETCFDFIKHHVGTEQSLSVCGVSFGLKPGDFDSDLIWYTNAYGVDGAVIYIDKEGNISPEYLFEQIWSAAKIESEPRDERGYLVE